MNVRGIRLDGQRRGQDRRLFRAGFVSFVILVGALGLLGIGALSREARATVYQPGWAGWGTSYAIYMTTGLTSTSAYVIPTMQSYYQTGTLSQGGNAVSLLVGQDRNTPSSDLVFHEYFDSRANAMLVWVPVALGGSSPMVWNGLSFQPAISYNEPAISASSSPNSMIQIQNGYNSALNMSGPNEVGTTQSAALQNLGIDSLSQISQSFGAYVAGFQIMNDFESLSGVYSYQLNAAGNNQAYQNFGTTGGSVGNGVNQDVWVSQTYTLITIPASEFSTYPVFTVTGTNLLAPFNTVSASTTVTVNAYPAVTLTGQATAQGLALPGATVNIQAMSGSESGTDFTVTADSAGNYRWFAEPSTTYSIWTTYTTAFGTTNGPSTTVTMPSSTTSATANPPAIAAISKIYGHVSSASTGAAISGATVAATLPAVPGDGCAVCAKTDSTGNYYFWVATTGTYTVQAYATGYKVATAYPVVSAMGTSVYQPFSLTPSSGGGGGCVLAGSEITVPNGQKRVQLLSQGDTVFGYIVTSGSWVMESVTSNTATNVIAVVSINNGLLVTTVTDQSLYVRNGTWTGWVHDPVDLTVGEQLYDPITASWITITSLQTLYGAFTVYDLRVTAPNDFVANGVLALDKIG